MTIIIPLSKTGKHKGKYETIVDDCDSDLAELNWCIAKGEGFYARASKRTGKKNKTIQMHRVILERMLGRPLEKGEIPDHINRNGLDNTRSNLRLATTQQNTFNTRLRRDNSTGYRNLHWNRTIKKFVVKFYVNGKEHWIGEYKNFEDAKRVRDVKAQEFFGEFWNDEC